MMELLNSLPEKNEQFDQHGYIEHWMFVGELQELLKHLKPDDWLTPNTVANLLISRETNGESANIGIINFHYNSIEYFDEKYGEDIVLIGED